VETFDMPLLKTKGIPALDLPNCEGWVNRNSSQQLGSNVRTFPTKFSSLRGDSGKNVDCSILKNTRIKERAMLQFRAEFLNAFNHAAFSGPQLNPTASNFGTITGVVNLERHVQMALRLTF